MSWKTTAALGVVALGVAIALWVDRSRQIRPDEARIDFLEGWTAAKVEAIEISSPGEVEIILRRTPAGKWTLVKTRSRVANEYMVEEMLRSLFSARRSAALKPGEKEYTPERYGLTRPRLTVSLLGSGRKIKLKFGDESPIHAGQVWFQIDGDPRIFFTTLEVVQSFQKDVHQLRSKQIAAYEVNRAVRVVLSRWENDPNDKTKWRYRVSEMERRDTGEQRGWFMVQPEERLDDGQVGALIAGIRAIVAEDFLPRPDLKEAGLEEAWLKVQIEFSDRTTFACRFGGEVKGKAKKMYVWLEGSDEVAVVDTDRHVKAIPQSRDTLRSRQVIHWSEAQTKRVEIEVNGLGKVVMVPENKTIGSGSAETVTRVWKPMEPPGVAYVEEEAHQFVAGLFSLELSSWHGKVDPSMLKGLKLDPPEVRLTFVLENQERTLLFGAQAGEQEEFALKKAWHDELYWVPAKYVRKLKRLDLNYRDPKVWDSGGAEKIRGFWWEDRSIGAGGSWQAAREGKTWRFTDQRSLDLKRELDPDRAEELLRRANLIKAKDRNFISRDSETRKRYGLETEPPARLWIITGRQETDRKVLYLSENLGKQHDPLYYARFEDDDVVFQIEAELVDLLLSGLHRRPAPEKRTDPRHDH